MCGGIPPPTEGGGTRCAMYVNVCGYWYDEPPGSWATTGRGRWSGHYWTATRNAVVGRAWTGRRYVTQYHCLEDRDTRQPYVTR
ncbi:unnamed protein product [Linum trigynum]|uniref:Uncharacterized protein n=1 Tax=Linum trigynum TaxID=586398 RepID=A0AAV2EC18_9ROSI